jgi:hypothetical protein
MLDWFVISLLVKKLATHLSNFVRSMPILHIVYGNHFFTSMTERRNKTKCTISYVVVHILGGRFVPDRLARKYSLDLPSYPGTDTCVKLD